MLAVLAKLASRALGQHLAYDERQPMLELYQTISSYFEFSAQTHGEDNS